MPGPPTSVGRRMPCECAGQDANTKRSVTTRRGAKNRFSMNLSGAAKACAWGFRELFTSVILFSNPGANKTPPESNQLIPQDTCFTISLSEGICGYYTRLTQEINPWKAFTTVLPYIGTMNRPEERHLFGVPPSGGSDRLKPAKAGTPNGRLMERTKQHPVDRRACDLHECRLPLTQVAPSLSWQISARSMHLRS